MDAITVRLECLKLAHHQGRDTREVIERAKEYESFVKAGKLRQEIEALLAARKNADSPEP